jgi:hypothetical protein
MRRPETARLELTQGDWLIVKKHLTAGEQLAMFAGMMNEGGDEIQRVKVGFNKILTYLLDWSFEDFDGKPLVIRDKPERDVAAMLKGKKRPGYRERIANDLAVAKIMGWRYQDVLDLPYEVYVILMEELSKKTDDA